MADNGKFLILTVGWDHSLVRGLADRIERSGRGNFAHIVHPRYTPAEWPECSPAGRIHFFRSDLKQTMPAADQDFLASLERDGVPVIHNMIMGDRVLARISYEDALRYASFLATRLLELFESIRPAAVIGGFDSLHGSMSLAVAKHLGLPWFALNFSVIPAGLACFCDGMSPAARVQITPSDSRLRSLATEALENFEVRKIQAPAYVPPPRLTITGKLAKLPDHLTAFLRTVQRSRSRRFLKFTEACSSYSVTAAMQVWWRAASAQRAVTRTPALQEPPSTPYVFFGLHFQPESSIDVWAPFFSNQMWVIELLARSTPPTHKLLVKIHKSDVAKYMKSQLERMRSFPGVELVKPGADTRQFIENSDLVVAIQGTIGLEAALLGKPVIMLGDSPATIFPSVSGVGKIWELPALVREKLTEQRPTRAAIIDAYVTYLAPFMRASHNDWTLQVGDQAIEDYAQMFDALGRYLRVDATRPRTASQADL